MNANYHREAAFPVSAWGFSSACFITTQNIVFSNAFKAVCCSVNSLKL